MCATRLVLVTRQHTPHITSAAPVFGDDNKPVVHQPTFRRGCRRRDRVVRRWGTYPAALGATEAEHVRGGAVVVAAVGLGGPVAEPAASPRGVAALAAVGGGQGDGAQRHCPCGEQHRRRRSPADTTTAPLPETISYCKIPHDAKDVVRGAPNYLCVDVPGKRAATPEECRSDTPYVPRGTNPWYGNPDQFRNCPAPAARCDQPSTPARSAPPHAGHR